MYLKDKKYLKQHFCFSLKKPRKVENKIIWPIIAPKMEDKVFSRFKKAKAFPLFGGMIGHMIIFITFLGFFMGKQNVALDIFCF